MSTVTKYFSLQGRLSKFKRNVDGSKGAGIWFQNVPKFDLAIEVSEESIKESHSGNKMKDLIFEVEKGIKTAYTLHGFALENLVSALWASRYTVATGTVSLTVSCGVAGVSETGPDLQILHAAADRALYAAKGTGRDRVAIHRASASGGRGRPGSAAMPAC